MAPPAPPHAGTPRSQKQRQRQHPDEGESDAELLASPLSSQHSFMQPDILQQFERMLHRALKQTSDQITECLSKEIRELGQCTSDLEQKVDELVTHLSNHTDELKAIGEENQTLQAQLEDYKNRARGILEAVVDLQSTITALFQELSPSFPIERLEMDRMH